MIEGPHFVGKLLTISGAQEGKAIISGGKKVKLKWEKAQGNIWKANLDSPSFEQLFVNGQKQILARYPNFKDSTIAYNGFSPDAIAPERVAKWQNPTNGSRLSKSGILKGDVILKANNETIKDAEALLAMHEQMTWTAQVTVQIMRNQERI